MGLFILIVGLAAVSFWAGFLARPHAWQYKSQAGFVVFVGLAVFTGYFAWREHRTVKELARLIDPVPEITDVLYVPTPTEVQAIARTVAAVPGEGRHGLGSTPEQRRHLAEDVETLQRRYWKLETKLDSDQVAEFYRNVRHRNGWDLTIDDAPWLGFERHPEALTILVQDDWKSPHTTVWYIYDPGL